MAFLAAKVLAQNYDEFTRASAELKNIIKCKPIVSAFMQRVKQGRTATFIQVTDDTIEGIALLRSTDVHVGKARGDELPVWWEEGASALPTRPTVGQLLSYLLHLHTERNESVKVIKNLGRSVGAAIAKHAARGVTHCFYPNTDTKKLQKSLSDLRTAGFIITVQGSLYLISWRDAAAEPDESKEGSEDDESQ